MNNLQSSAELYERLAQGKQISLREEQGIFALSQLLNSFEKQLDSPTRSLPSSLSSIKGYKTLNGLSSYLTALTDDVTLYLVTSHHVVALYRFDHANAYFDNNVAWVTGLQHVDQLIKTIKE